MTNSITRINAVDIVTVEKDGQIFVPVKPICDAIGIAFQPQHIKLQEDDFLAPTVTIIVTVAADGKNREIVCLSPLKYTYPSIPERLRRKPYQATRRQYPRDRRRLKSR